MWAHISRFILRYKLFLLISLLFATVFMANKAIQVQYSYEFLPLLPEDDPIYTKYQEFLGHFGQEGNVMVVGFQCDSLYQLENYNAYYDLYGQLKEIEGVEQVVSILQARNMKKNEALKSFEFKPVTSQRYETQKEVDAVAKELASLPFYRKLFYNDKNKTHLMALTLDKQLLDDASRIDLILSIEDVINPFAEQIGVDVHYSGLPYIRTKSTVKTKAEVEMFIFLAMGVTAFIMLLFFRSFSAMFYSMLVVGIGVVWAIATLVLLGFKITILTALIPPLIIVIGIPNCIFLLNKYHNEFKLHGNKIKAMTRVIQKVGNATFMTNATTAAGFATFVITQTQMLVEFGIVASINILLVFFISLIIIPSIYSFLPTPKDRHLSHLERTWMNKLSAWMEKVVLNHRNIVYFSTVLLLVFAFYGVSKIETTGNIVDDIPKDDPIAEDLDFFERNFAGVMPFEVMVNTHKSNGVSKSSTLKRIQKLENVLAEYPEISSTSSIADLAKFSKQAYYNGNPDYYSLPSSQEKNFILKYAKNTLGDSADIFNSFIDSTKSVARISARMKDIGTKQMRSLRDSIKPKIDAIFNPEKYDVSITGTSVLFLEGTTYLVKNLFSSLLLAISLIAILMAWMFSSSRMVVVSLLPNLIPLVLTGALMGYFNISIKPSTILVFSIAFGISIDDTIHFLAKYRQELKANHWNIRRAVINALKETGVSMFYTSIVLFFGFSIFIASDFGGTVALGLLVSVTLLFAMMANLLLLPSLLLSLERMITTRSFREPLIDILDEEEDIELDALKIRKES
ncbi:MAG: transporter [Bacteroidetes bacterium MED-G21]|nr:MAG: transporter [Bacteroidetes bacterium MED-G21]